MTRDDAKQVLIFVIIMTLASVIGYALGASGLI